MHVNKKKHAIARREGGNGVFLLRCDRKGVAWGGVEITLRVRAYLFTFTAPRSIIASISSSDEPSQLKIERVDSPSSAGSLAS